MRLKNRLAPFVEFFAESTAACLVTMVQGNVLILGLGHLVIASQTGFAAGLIAYVSVFLAKAKNQWKVSLILGLATTIADYFVHPGMFGPVATEAVVTGLGAAGLSYLIAIAVRRFRPRPQVTN